MDADNTLITSAVLFNVGDGSKGEGIHWHVENKINFGKDEDGKIVYLEVEKEDGETGIYRLNDSKEPIAFKEMDCIDCHNRVAHNIETPSDIVDRYLLEEKLDSSLPYVKRKTVKLLLDTLGKDTSFQSELFDSIVSFYEQEYPEIYEQQQEEIDQLPEVIGDMVSQITYPEMKAD